MICIDIHGLFIWQIDRVEYWVLKLIPQLVSHIIKESELDDIKEAALFTLANICRGNNPAIKIYNELNEQKVSNIKSFVYFLFIHNFSSQDVSPHFDSNEESCQSKHKVSVDYLRNDIAY